jgi:hypothetical protein
MRVRYYNGRYGGFFRIRNYCFYITKFIVIISTCLPFWQRELPAELKESYRWSESIDKTADLIGEDVLITMLSDRESDVYEVLRLVEC